MIVVSRACSRRARSSFDCTVIDAVASMTMSAPSCQSSRQSGPVSTFTGSETMFTSESIRRSRAASRLALASPMSSSIEWLAHEDPGRHRRAVVQPISLGRAARMTHSAIGPPSAPHPQIATDLPANARIGLAASRRTTTSGRASRTGHHTSLADVAQSMTSRSRPRPSSRNLSSVDCRPIASVSCSACRGRDPPCGQVLTRLALHPAAHRACRQ